MGEAGAEAGGVEHEHISDNLMARQKAVKDAIDRGDAEIELDCFGIGLHLGLGEVCCDHWGRMYWHRRDLGKLVKIYDPTDTRTNRVDTAVVKQLNKSMDLNRNMKTAIRELRSTLIGQTTDQALGTLDEILRMS